MRMGCRARVGVFARPQDSACGAPHAFQRPEHEPAHAAAPGDVRGRSRRQAERAHDNVVRGVALGPERRSWYRRRKATCADISPGRRIVQTTGEIHRQVRDLVTALIDIWATLLSRRPTCGVDWGIQVRVSLSPDRRQAEHLLVSRRSGLSSPSECDTPPRIPGRFRFSMRNSWPRPAVAPVRRFPS